MVVFTLFFVFGIWLLQQQTTLPNLDWLWALCIFPLALLLPKRWRILRVLLIAACATGIGFYHATWQAQQRLVHTLASNWQGQDIDVIGVVAELPKIHERGYRFRLDIEKVLTPQAIVPAHVYLNSYSQHLHFHAGERWQLRLRLKQVHGTSNPYSYDFELWALENNIRAVGYVHNKGDNQRLTALADGWLYQIEAWREQIRNKFVDTLGNAPYTSTLVALSIGDQTAIPQSQWQVFTRTGVNHLMSISGLHITMLASMAYAIAYWLWRRSTWLTLHFPARKIASLLAFITALSYALLAGFAVPAQRTVYMVGAVTLALWLNRNFSVGQILSIALLAVTLIDPWSVLAAGFWLSFGAVALILFVSNYRVYQQRPTRLYQRLLHMAREATVMQWAITIGLIPLLLALFQQISLVSPIANAFAIPLISLVVVPLSLAGAFLPTEVPLWLAHICMDGCMVLLEYLNQLPQAVWTQHAPPTWTIAGGVCGVIWLLLPAGFPARWLGFVMMLPMFLNTPERPSIGNLKLIIFDVGQGLSVVAQTQNHALLYDAGPDFSGEADSGNRMLVPSLRALGISELDQLILSHNDSDHTGGTASILQAMPVAQLNSSLPNEHALLSLANSQQRCIDGQNWQWDGVNFAILHPDKTLYDQPKTSKNNLSCVLRISIGEYSVLITGDIEKRAEAELVKRYENQLHTSLLVVPHHGSKTSSTFEFLTETLPDYAVFTAGYRSRYGHPKPEVVQRYLDSGAKLLRSDSDGAIIVNMSQQGLQLSSYRKTHQRYWSHQPETTAVEESE